VTAARIEAIRIRLTAALAPSALEIVDDSAKHAGHAGARDGRGHFRVVITSVAFAGLGPVQRHRRVYAALGELMKNEIHALAITALTPDEQVNSYG
jgi:BolA protein